MTTRVLSFVVLLIIAVPAHADTIYSYVGSPFAVVSGIYEAGDHLIGSITLPDGFAYDPNSSLSSIPIFSFTDGHQTLTQENSTGVFDRGFTTTVLGSGYDSWYIAITGLEPSTGFTTTHGMGSCCNLHDRAVAGTGYAYSTIGYPRMEEAAPQGTWTISTPELVIFPKLLPRLLGWGVEAKITHGLQRATTWLAAAILRAPHSATEIYLPALTVKVIEECAGYQTLGLMLLVAGLIAAVSQSISSLSSRFSRSPGTSGRTPSTVPMNSPTQSKEPTRPRSWTHCARICRMAARSMAVLLVHQRAVAILALFLAAALLSLEANALRVVLIALGGEHRDGIQYATTAIALGQLAALGRFWGRWPR